MIICRTAQTKPKNVRVLTFGEKLCKSELLASLCVHPFSGFPDHATCAYIIRILSLFVLASSLGILANDFLRAKHAQQILTVIFYLVWLRCMHLDYFIQARHSCKRAYGLSNIGLLVHTWGARLMCGAALEYEY